MCNIIGEASLLSHSISSDLSLNIIQFDIFLLVIGIHYRWPYLMMVKGNMLFSKRRIFYCSKKSNIWVVLVLCFPLFVFVFITTTIYILKIEIYVLFVTATNGYNHKYHSAQVLCNSRLLLTSLIIQVHNPL